ncbi:MBL fold metallo-hydrolase [Telluribacter sp.]|jgi:beta-lactamase superfamily II metal-dependent hydrolase|uniref:MBL fold metallo-hydrolase n=1 Tax=Telluribacter sp. TaxID=1978767 RepID=UPI002E10B24B|nr:MBL fold metallo-hydrolase [Telluribacter sp.]
MEIDNTSPNRGEIEITVIGTGGGYGESLIIHDGTGQWIIVDSCISPDDDKNLPLEYLNHLGVDLANSVKLIVCTHWHDDHIKGLADIYRECSSAEITFSQAHDQGKFLYFVSLDALKLKDQPSMSSTHEFNTILEILINRNKSYLRAQSDHLLHSVKLGGKLITIFALSPSSSTLDRFDEEISQLIQDFGSRESKIVIEKPNEKSVALLFTFGAYTAIFGADLEIGNQENSGWFNILDNLKCIDRETKSIYFKIPHHGSENGYHSRIWEELLSENPVATLTPWNRNNGLPTDDMLKIYRGLSNNLYITSTKANFGKAKKRARRLEKLIKDFDLVVSEVKNNYGIIRYRLDIVMGEAPFKIELAGAAIHLRDSI